MDYRSRILAAIDRLQRGHRPIDSADVGCEIESSRLIERERVRIELRAMAKDGLVAYDRKACGWRRA